MFSDRVGEELADGGSVEMGAGPLSRALRTLDAITASELEIDGPPGAVAGAVAPEVAEPLQGERTVGRPASSSRREEILDAAAALFAERGYHGASLRDISRRVGISHPGMLHHFASKEALLGAVVDRLEAHAQGLLDSVEVLQSSPSPWSQRWPGRGIRGSTRWRCCPRSALRW
ncbi:TetR/AcrR family transcriptional regulator [Brachybacterium avium]|uniref:TetR/AcrR family transcriptional regulator n=1 Tax=Brachybacterium avium TaxID=2017485 RepID=UPI001FE488CB|nr:helix-turn-helix domain-containing protein [Brachybacterium avium]